MSTPADETRRDDEDEPISYVHRAGGSFDAGDPEPQIEPALQRQIGQSLQAMYSDLLNQPVPDHLLDLVKRLHA